MGNVMMQSRLEAMGYLFAKRFFDVSAGLLALIVLSPIIVMLSLVIKLDSPGDVFFRQQRVGKNGKCFAMFKFRTLYTEHFGLFTDQEAPHDYRITKIGKYLRRSKLDEIPQFVNVVWGSMSIVGPRPDLPLHVEKYLSFQHERFLVKPGMTGLSQVSGNTLLLWPERILLDIWYVKNRSWMLDMKIVAYTLVTIIRGDTLAADPFKVHALLPGRKNNA